MLNTNSLPIVQFKIRSWWETDTETWWYQKVGKNQSRLLLYFWLQLIFTMIRKWTLHGSLHCRVFATFEFLCACEVTNTVQTCNFQAVMNPLQALWNAMLYQCWSCGAEHVHWPCSPCTDSSPLYACWKPHCLNHVAPLQDEDTPLLCSHEDRLHNARLSISGF
jgi:hypothetical protein